MMICGSGFAVLIELADGSSQVFIDGMEADLDIDTCGVIMEWKAPGDAKSKRDQHYVDLKKSDHVDP
jgi:hypothetical protein